MDITTRKSIKKMFIQHKEAGYDEDYKIFGYDTVTEFCSVFWDFERDSSQYLKYIVDIVGFNRYKLKL